MPTDNNEREYWAKVKSVFQRYLDDDSPEREQNLLNDCGNDVQLLSDVRELIAGSDLSDTQLHGAIANVASNIAATNPSLEMPTEVGPYRLVRLIGEGGMGAVYLAERSDGAYEQQVAIKFLTTGTMSPSAQQRFAVERQMLANLNHPYIAQLHDGGTTDDGTPYLVMEYVSGRAVDLYCDEEQLSIDERLRLFDKICEAVDHAHRNLIVHRDIKPSNIMVTADGQPKLLDFGIAKLVDPDEAAQDSDLTRATGRALTPDYASPEQLRDEAVTTATDVYSLGVLLYFLLAGRYPYERTGMSATDMARLIGTTEPQRPSRQFADTLVAEENHLAAETARHRSTTPASLARRLRGDLDNIVMVALRKSADRRYSNARQFQIDIRNYLAQKPVQARPETATYLAHKFIQRNRWSVGATAAVLTVLIGMISYYTLQLATERDNAQLAAQKANEVTAFLTDIFREADPQRSLGQPVTARQMLDRGATRIRTELSGQPELRAALMSTVGQSYLNMAEIRPAGAYVREAIEIAEADLGGNNEHVLELRRILGISESLVGNYDTAKTLHEENYRRLVETQGARSLAAGMELRQIAFVKSRLGAKTDAESHFLESIEILREHGDSANTELIFAILDLTTLLGDSDRYEEELALLLETQALTENIFGLEHPMYAGVINNLGNHFFNRGLLSKSEPYMLEHVALQKKLYGDNSLLHGVALHNFSALRTSQGRTEEALQIHIAAREIYRVGYGEDSVRYAYSLENGANLLNKLERFDEAEVLYLEALASLRNIFGADNPEYAFTQSNYGGFLNNAGRLDEAIPVLTEAAETFDRELGPSHTWTIPAKLKLADSLIRSDDLENATIYAEEALAGAREAYSEPSRRLAESLRLVGAVRSLQLDYESSDALFRESIDVSMQIELEPIRKTVQTELSFMESLVRQGRAAEARVMLQSRLDSISAEEADYPDQVRQLKDALAELPSL